MKHSRLILAPSLMLLLLISGCGGKVKTAPGKTPQPVLDSIAVQIAQAKDGAKAVRKVKEALLAEGKITKETSHAITLKLIVIDRVLDEMNSKLATYESFTPTAKADLLKLFHDLESGYGNLKDQGVFPANAGVDKALLIVDAAVSALGVFLR